MNVKSVSAMNFWRFDKAVFLSRASATPALSGGIPNVTERGAALEADGRDRVFQSEHPPINGVLQE